MKKLLLSSALLSAITVVNAQPLISSLSAGSGNPGTSISISGSGFNTTAANNIVYFGATKATVTSASATSLTVQVPTGATYAPVSVHNTSTNLAGSSQYPFVPRFDNSAYLPNSVNFGAAVNITPGNGQNDAAIADLDGDGKPDLAVVNRTSGAISVFRNVSTTGALSNSSFSAAVNLSLPGSFTSIAIADMDGDGKPDLVAGGPGVCVYRNISTSGTITSSSFATRVDIYPSTSGVTSLAISDLDRDGKSDIALVSNMGVFVLRNTATPGSFTTSSLEAAVSLSMLSCNDLAIGDLDGDGRQDIAAISYGSSLALIRNISSAGSISTASFAPAVEYTAYPYGTSHTMAMADIDGDGKLDILLANEGFHLLSVYRNNFTPGVFTSTSLDARVDFPTTLTPIAIAISDFDGDSKPDVAICNENNNSYISIFRNSASPGSINANSLAPRVDYSTSATHSGIAVGDLDADGYPDIVATFGVSNVAAIIKNRPLLPPPAISAVNPSIADPGTSVTITGTGFNPSAANNAVYFGATRATVTAASATSLSTSVPAGATFMPVSVSNVSSKLIADAAKPFLPTFGSGLHTSADTLNFDTGVHFSLGGSAPSQKIVIEDIDGDGKPDVVVLHASTNSMSIYRNTSASGALSSGSFAPKVDFTLTFASHAVAIGDLDGDGKPDLAFANSASFVSILRNTSTPGTINASSFASSVELGSGSCNNILLNDLDGDGRLDIVITHSGVVNVYRNLAVPGTIAASSFAREFRLVTPGEPTSVSIGDIDGDNKPDVVTANSGSGNISVFRNMCTPGFLGAHGFATRVDINIGFNTRSVTLGDFDGDGKLDLAFPGPSNYVSVIRNNNVPGSVLAGSFETKVDYPTGTLPFPLVVADFNGDSKPDIAMLNYTSDNSFTVLRNVSTTGSFTTGSFARKNVSIGFNSSGLAAGDLDADGKPEIVLTNYIFTAGGYLLSVFRNNIVDPISGVDSICVGNQLTLSNATSGGVWNSANTSVATINSTGIVTAVAAGTTTISYTTTVGTVTTVVTVMASPVAGTITGASSVNGGSSITLSASVSGGVWSASNASATVSSTGVVNGVSFGTVTISYTVTNGCGTDVATKVITVIATGVTGSPVVCMGATTTLTGSPSGGTWTSGNTPRAVVNAAGVVTGLSAGTVRISYNVGGSTVVTVVTVNTTPSVFSGSLSLCNGAATTIGATPTGGTWTSSDPAIGTITAAGIFSGLSIGTSTISYALSNGCARSAVATVNAVPSAISGITDVCVGSSSTLTNAVAGGVFSSGNSTIATVSLAGMVTGVAAGSTLISYSIGSCRVTTTVSVTASPAITGSAAACVGATTLLSNASSGGVWSSGNASVAAVNATGLVSGIAAGTATISYTLSAGCTRMQVVTINAIPAIGGASSVCLGGLVNLTSTPATTSWTSSDPAIATISASGLLTPVSEGATTISVVTLAGCTNSTVISVTAQPAIGGTGVVCINNTTNLIGSPTGGVWSSSSAGISSVNAVTGLVTGVNTGTATISYSLGAGCSRTAIVTVNALPAITGTPVMCVNGSVAIGASPAGGAWSTADPSTATVSAAGVVTGQASGNTNIIYTNATTGCSRSVIATINATPGAFTGTTNICAGTTSSLSNATSGGTWSSSNPAIASAALATGVITGAGAGAATITYRIGTCSATTPFTVRALPNAITGGMQTVVGATATLASTTPGGTWSSSDPAIGTISATGVVTGVATGTSNVVYTAPNACTRSVVVTINAVPVLPGPRNLCVGSTITISSPGVSVSSWTSSNTTVATVNVGIVSGVAPGTSTITYVLTAGGYATTEVTVLPLPAVITGTRAVCVGSVTSLSNATPGGTWACSNSSLGTIDVDGVVTGVNNGVGTISYTLPTGCRRTANLTVNVLPAPITGAATVCAGTTMFPYLASPSSGTWTSADVAIATVPTTHGAVTGVAAGTVLISLTNAVGCSISKEITVVVCPSRGMLPGTTGVTNLNNANLSISLYPNPTKGAFSVNTPEAGVLSISTIDGREVMTRKVGTDITEFNLPAGITAGVYMCRFVGDNGATTTVRLVFEAD